MRSHRRTDDPTPSTPSRLKSTICCANRSSRNRGSSLHFVARKMAPVNSSIGFRSSIGHPSRTYSASNRRLARLHDSLQDLVDRGPCESWAFSYGGRRAARTSVRQRRARSRRCRAVSSHPDPCWLAPPNRAHRNCVSCKSRGAVGSSFGGGVGGWSAWRVVLDGQGRCNDRRPLMHAKFVARFLGALCRVRGQKRARVLQSWRLAASMREPVERLIAQFVEAFHAHEFRTPLRAEPRGPRGNAPRAHAPAVVHVAACRDSPRRRAAPRSAPCVCTTKIPSQPASRRKAQFSVRKPSSDRGRAQRAAQLSAMIPYADAVGRRAISLPLMAPSASASRTAELLTRCVHLVLLMRATSKLRRWPAASASRSRRRVSRRNDSRRREHVARADPPRARRR